MDSAIPLWALIFSYWVHLLATAVWLGGLALMALVAWPAWQRRQLAANQWHEFQQRFVPWINGSLVLLLLTGFLQMTADPNYEGFLAFGSLWSQAILLKHIAFVGMVAITAYLQVSLYPAMKRLRLLAGKRPQLAAAEQEQLTRQEIRLLRLNLFCAVVVLFFTAVATAL
jgi:putative copper export protein